MLIPKKLLDGRIDRRVQRHFPNRDIMDRYFASIFEYLDAPSNLNRSTGANLQRRREEARSRPVSVVGNDLALFWNTLGDTLKAKLVPGALVEVPFPEDQAWAMWQAAQTLTRIARNYPGSVIIATLMAYFPRSRRFVKNVPRLLRTQSEEVIKQLELNEGRTISVTSSLDCR